MPRKRKTNSRSRKPATKREYNNKEMREKELDTSKSSNEPSWYAADPAIMRDAFTIPFSWPTGASDIVDLSIWSNVTGKPYSKIPGILTFLTVPSIGTATLSTDPINVAAQSVYSYVRHANSGHSNYDATDLMLYILAMANFYSFLVWCQRIYGFAMTYDQRNRYLPRELMRTDNVDPDSIINNLANFRFWINTLIAKAASFAVPATMSIFSRMSFLYSGLYIEGTTIKDQMYKFSPDGFYQFNINSGTSMGELIYQQFNRSNLLTVSDIITYGNTLFDAIWGQEDFGIMSGDILKAYGERIIKLQSIPEMYAIIPQFDPVVLTQMKNAKLLNAEPGSIGQASGKIIQIVQPHNYTTSDKDMSGAVLSSGAVAGMTGVRLNILKDYKVLTVDTDNATPEVVVEATRLMYGYDAYLGYVRVGTEFVHDVIITYDVGSDLKIGQVNMPSQINGNNGFLMGDYLSKMISFHYMPQTFWYTSGSSALANADVVQIFDIDNFAVLDNEDVIKMHSAAVINMLAVPSVGRVL